MIRRQLKTGAARALCSTGVDRLLGFLSRQRMGPLVVAYHRVVADFASSAELSIPSMLVSRRTLEQHLDCIGRDFRFISLDDLGARLESGKGAREPVVAITFDDGYQDFYYHAFPLLRERGIPAAVFVASDLIGTNAVHAHDKLYLLLQRGFADAVLSPRTLSEFLRGLGILLPHVRLIDPFSATRALLQALPQAGVQAVIKALEAEIAISEESTLPFHALTWEMLNEMHGAGVTIGSHTKTHALMTNESRQRGMEEATGSRAEIERRLGIRIQHFSYPDGRFDADCVEAVRAAGYRFGYTICEHRDHRQPRLTVSRIVLWENSSRDSDGVFSPEILQCQAKRVLGFGWRCRQDHGTNRRGTNGGDM